MWFFGLLLGLVLGGLMESLFAALFFGVIGALFLPFVLKDKSAGKVLGPDASGDDRVASNLAVAPSVARSADGNGPYLVGQLQLKVMQLERRLIALEQRVSGGAAVEADPETDETVVEASTAALPARVVQRPEPDHTVPIGTPVFVPGAVPVLPLTLAQRASEEQARIKMLPKMAVPVSVLGATPSSPVPAPPVRAPTPDQPPIIAAPLPPPLPAVPLRDRLPAPIRKLIFGGNMLVKLGVLILFLGLAFLLRYTAERVTVPVELRYAAVALVGAGLLALGWLLRHRRASYALILQGAGIGVFYLTTLTAMKLNELLPPTVGFGFLFAIAVLSAVLAVLQNAPLLAIVAALEGFAAPVLASTGENRPMALFTYLLVLDVGIFLVAWFKAWRVLNVIGFVGTFTLTAGWAQRNYTADQYGLVQPFLIVFFLLFTVIGLLFARRTLAEAAADETLPLATRAADTLRRVGRVDSALVFGVPMVAFGLQYLLMRPWEFGAAFSALALSAFYLLLGRLVFSTQPRGLALLAEAYAVIGVIFGTLAIPLGLEGQWTGATWAVEAAGMYWLGVRQARPYARAFSFAVLAGALVQMLRVVTVDGAPGQPLLHGSVIGPLMMAGGVFSMWALLRRAKLNERSNWESAAGTFLPWIGMAALSLLPWQTLAPAWAASVISVMALATFAVALRWKLHPLRPIAYAMQALASLAFVSTLELNTGIGQPLVQGNFTGLLIIGVSLLSMWMLRERFNAQPDTNGTWEPLAAAALPWAGMVALTLLLWLTLIPSAAAAGTALLAAVTFVVAVRFALKPLRAIVHAMQALAVVAFIATLHGGEAGEAALASGWQGMLSAGLIALSVLATAVWTLRRAHLDALATGIPPVWSTVQIVGVLAGVGLLHLAMLFGIDLPLAALIWPFTAVIMLWAALRIALAQLAVLAGLVHVMAAGLLILEGGHSWASPAFAHLGFWTPLALGLTALVAADWIRAQARHAAAMSAVRSETSAMVVAPTVPTAVGRWVNTWCAQPVMPWLSLLWGLLWWIVASLGESLRVLEMNGLFNFQAAAAVAVILVTSVVANVVSARRDWHQLRQITITTLPAFALVAAFGILQTIQHQTFLPPSTGFGWLVWPVALVWHVRLLHAQRRWSNAATMGRLHVAGVWFFTAMAARECQWQFGQFGQAGESEALGSSLSSWPLLGWVLVPIVVLWAMRSRALLRRWPLAEYRSAYLEIAGTPIAVYLLGWALITNVLSPGNAEPLPHVPLLNPLELAQWLALFTVTLWWQALPEASAVRRQPQWMQRGLALAVLALLTGVVLRACHNYADVDWNVPALHASTLTQAALSITWALCGVVAMVSGHRQGARTIWIAGAALLGIVVLKLFFVELADRDGLFRIVSFIGVGALLLLVGYFAPVPPAVPSVFKEKEA